MEQNAEQNAPQTSDGATRQALQPWRTEQHVHMLFANMSEGFALGEAVFDADGRAVDVRLLEVNDAFWRQLGLPHSSPSMIGLPLSEIIPGIKQFWIDCNGVADKFRVLSDLYSLVDMGKSVIFVQVPERSFTTQLPFQTLLASSPLTLTSLTGSLCICHLDPRDL